MKTKVQICDCTLRDGGYYTDWDFDMELTKIYLKTMNDTPAITHIEIGYRSKLQDEYLGEYFYCPEHILALAKQLCPKKEIAVMLNEKNTKIEDVKDLLAPYKNYIDVIRTAVAPANLMRAVKLAEVLKKTGFKVAFNLMYMSKWIRDNSFLDQLKCLDGKVDYVYMVDSFGGVYPEDVKEALRNIKRRINLPVGFHGHNNMELALANTLTAIENGCDIVDSTITGMGRGAGNLRTELLLTCLNSKNIAAVDYNKFYPILNEFEKLQKKFSWGTSLPYMISGAYSLPQKDVMSWISKKRYTTDSIINALQNRKNNLEDNFTAQKLENEPKARKVVIVGGGTSVNDHAHALELFCKNNNDLVLIHAGTRHVSKFANLSNRQYYCLLGAEGYKLKKSLGCLDLKNIKCIIEPSPRPMGTILPEQVLNTTYELPKISFINDYPDSLLTIAFQLSIELHASEVHLFGFDGYDVKTDDQMIEVSSENQLLIDTFIDSGMILTSLIPTKYNNIKVKSIYALI